MLPCLEHYGYNGSVIKCCDCRQFKKKKKTISPSVVRMRCAAGNLGKAVVSKLVELPSFVPEWNSSVITIAWQVISLTDAWFNRASLVVLRHTTKSSPITRVLGISRIQLNRDVMVSLLFCSWFDGQHPTLQPDLPGDKEKRCSLPKQHNPLPYIVPIYPRKWETRQAWKLAHSLQGCGLVAWHGCGMTQTRHAVP